MARGHIAGLDGLRSVAVIAVLAFHLWPHRVPGGFVGVDAFFVVSGFLITTLLMRERRQHGGVALGQFWLRRARRLLPALAVVVVVSVTAARFVEPDLLVGTRRQVLGAFTFSTNWVETFAGTDYFSHATPSLFLTFWSLAVEEQFYLVWPLVFAALAARRVSLRTIARGARVVGLASALLMAVLVLAGSSITRVYYGTDTHLFGLLSGVGLAFAFVSGRGLVGERRWQRIREWIGVAGLVGFVALCATLDGESTFTYPVGLLLASVCALAMVAALPGRETAFVRWGEARPLVWIGQRSYGIYLWHWPVLLVASELLEPDRTAAGAGLVTSVVVLAVTFGLSAVSFRWVEMPIRRDGLGRALGSAVLASRRRRAEGLPAWPLWTGCVVATALVVTSIVAVAGAPGVTLTEESVTAGQRAIDAQAPLVTTVAPPAVEGDPVDGVVPTTAAPPPTINLDGPAWSTDLAVPPGDHMVALGDSVMSGAAPALFRTFPGIFVDAKPIRQWDAAPPIVDRMVRAGTMRRVVVINFGTNAGLVTESSQQALRHVLDALGPRRRVVLMAITGLSKWVPSTNETMRQIAAAYPNVAVADWPGVVHAFPGLLHRDRTHPNLKGIDAYAQLVANTLDELGPGE